MNTLTGLDLKDKKILYQLDLNSRQSNTRIAKKVSLSKEVVNYRINRLEKEGFIKGYHTIIDFSKMGYISIRVHLKLLDVNSEKESEIYHFLTKNPKVLFVLEANGPTEIYFGVLAKTIIEFDEFYSKFKIEFKENILEDRIAIYTKIYNFHRAYLLDKQKDDSEAEISENKLEIEHDEIDLKILKILSSNARAPLLDISTKLRLSPKTIVNRIKKLEKVKIIMGYRYIFGFEKINYEYYRLDLYLKNTSRMIKIIQFCHQNPNIIYAIQTIGGEDLALTLEVKNNNQLSQIVNQLRKEFPEIRSWTTSNLQGYKKFIYFPEI